MVRVSAGRMRTAIARPRMTRPSRLRISISLGSMGWEPNGSKPVSKTCRDTNGGFSAAKARDLVVVGLREKKAAPGWAADKLGCSRRPDLRPATSDHRETLFGTVASNDDHLLLSAC